jgi:hypothetical protein
MTADPFASFAPPREEQRPVTERPSLRADVDQLAEQVAALRDLVERTLLPAIAGQGIQGLPGQPPAVPGAFLPGIPGQQFLQPGLVTQHDARRTVLHHLNGGQVTIGGIEQHLELDPIRGSRTSEQTLHRYLGLDGRVIHEQGEVYACTSCERYPLTNPHFCSMCQEPTCSGCLIGYQNNFFCRRHDPRPSFWESLFG